MKTWILCAGVLAAAITLASCEKTYNCVCVDADKEVVETYTYSESLERSEDLCAAAADLLNDIDSLGITYTCTLD